MTWEECQDGGWVIVGRFGEVHADLLPHEHGRWQMYLQTPQHCITFDTLNEAKQAAVDVLTMHFERNVEELKKLRDA